MILSLLWKDLRLTVPVILAAAVLTVAPYVCMTLLAYTMAPGGFPWAEVIMSGAHFGQWLLLLTAALLGGNAFASEREDRSVHFLVSLPVRPQDVLFSKAVVTLLVFECLWILNAAIVHTIAPLATVGFRDRLLGAAGMTSIASLSLMALGLSWFWSVFMARPLVAAMTGLLSSGAILLVLRTCVGFHIRGDSIPHAESLSSVAVTLGIVGFLAACGVFLFRGELALRATSNSRTRNPEGLQEPRSTKTTAAFRKRTPPNLALAWKDWRLVRVLLLVGLALVALPYVYATGLALIAGDLPESFARASTQSLWLCCPVFAALGGYLVATERRTESNDFLAALPMTQSHAATSRLLLTAVPATIVLGVNTCSTLAFHNAAFLPAPIGESGRGFFDMTWSLLLWQQTSLLFALPAIGAPLVCFGVAWLGAVRLAKPYVGIALGAVSSGVALVAWMEFSSLVEERLAPLPAALVFAATACMFATMCVLWSFRYLSGGETT